MEYLNSMYYTLSTIAQVLAAFIALGGVFILFKLQELDRILLKQAGDLRHHIINRPPIIIPSVDYSYLVIANAFLNDLIQCKVTTGLLGQLRIIRVNPETIPLPTSVTIFFIIKFMENIIHRKRIIKILTFCAIIISTITIIYSLIYLRYTYQLSEICTAKVLMYGILLASIAIGLMTLGIVLSLIESKIR